ncbi:MAG: hypothetical protein NTZ24_08070 [Deltaproteobacteria bacterium]|nr:hypothetical protein [Deltaproteobacteria bacterium]
MPGFSRFRLAGLPVLRSVSLFRQWLCDRGQGCLKGLIYPGKPLALPVDSLSPAIPKR